MPDGVVYANKNVLFTLKGKIAVHLMDGEIIEGEFATQDAYNVFVQVDNEPLMVPRLQIRWIRGLQGQQIERDSSPDSIVDPLSTQPMPEQASADQVSPPPLPVVEKPAPLLSDETRDAIILPPADVDEDEDEGTLILVTEPEPEPEPAGEDGTVVLPTSSDELLAAVAAASAPAPVAPPVEVEAETGAEAADEIPDMTVVLDHNLDISEPENDDIVFPLHPEKPKELGGQLTCVAGPHSGQVFMLASGITTIGRSADNVVALTSDKEISRRHAIILKESSQFVIQDQNSLNGTFVNEQQITGPHYLVQGDVILVGVSSLRIELS